MKSWPQESALPLTMLVGIDGQTVTLPEWFSWDQMHHNGLGSFWLHGEIALSRPWPLIYTLYLRNHHVIDFDLWLVT